MANKGIIGTFSDGVRGAIPGAGLQLEIITELIGAWSPFPFTILDLGCGDGILGRMLPAKYPEAHTIFADYSEPMPEKVRQKFDDSKMATVLQIDFATPNWTNAVKAQTPFDIIVSGFAIHHQPDDRKKALYTEIYNLLKEGGIFLNLDQVRLETSVISKIFDSFFLENIRCSLPNPDQSKMMNQIEKANYEDKKENIPAPIEQLCKWLRSIGFKEVDCFFKTFELALFGGQKTSNNTIAKDVKSCAAE